MLHRRYHFTKGKTEAIFPIVKGSGDKTRFLDYEVPVK